MKKYKITVNYEAEIYAEDEHEALTTAEDEMNLENDSIWNHFVVKEIK
jgi:hypothetical protein